MSESEGHQSQAERIDDQSQAERIDDLGKLMDDDVDGSRAEEEVSTTGETSKAAGVKKNNLDFSVKGDVIKAGDLVIVMAGAGRTEQLVVEISKLHPNQTRKF